MRGIRSPRRLLNRIDRITPAHAGNTHTSDLSPMRMKDHPRACGEYMIMTNLGITDMGSPPRMRGIRILQILISEPLGITPAHAGNTPMPGRRLIVVKDHPRACGEYGAAPRSHTLQSGSPPRMRGIHTHVQRSDTPYGITPAHAGNTRPDIEVNSCTGDHPRACGEYSVPDGSGDEKPGSPPRMRGILHAV